MNGSHLSDFESKKKQVVEFGERLGKLAAEGRDGEAVKVLADFMARFSKNRFLLLVVGDFKSGKSSLVNALVGRSICPVRATPRTAKVTRLTCTEPGAPEIVEIVFRKDRKPERQPLEGQTLDDVVAVGGKRTADVELVDVYLKPGTTLLRHPVRLVDTPGIGSGETEHSKTARDYAKHADAVLFTFSASKAYSETERDYLLTFRSMLGRVVFAVNRIDDIPESERPEILEHIRSSLIRDVLPEGHPAPDIHAVSATQSLAALNAGDDAALERSGLPAVVNALEQCLASDLAVGLLRDIAKQQESVCEGLVDRAQLAQDALEAASKSANSKAPEISELKKELAARARESKTLRARTKKPEEALLEWAPGRIAELRKDLVGDAARWIRNCRDEDMCRRDLPGYVARIIADRLDVLDRELLGAFRSVQQSVDVELCDTFDGMNESVRRVLAPDRPIPADARGRMSGRASALNRLAALGGGVGGPTEGYGLASAAVRGALAPSPTVGFLSVAAAVSFLLAALGGPIGWAVAGVASFLAVVFGFDHAVTWRERVLEHVAKGVDAKIIPGCETSTDESIRSFFAGVTADAENRRSGFLEQLESLISDIERERERAERDRGAERSRLREHLGRLTTLSGEVAAFVSSLGPAPSQEPTVASPDPAR